MRRVASIVSVLAVAAGCVSGAGTTAPVAPPAAQCDTAPAALVAAISSGLTITGGGTIRNAKAVKSTVFEQAWFVSADLEGSGLEGADDIATWVTNDLNGGGSIFAVGGVANEFSEWGNGGTTDAGFSMSDDGAEASAECAKG